jgi:hypothetical protein
LLYGLFIISFFDSFSKPWEGTQAGRGAFFMTLCYSFLLIKNLWGKTGSSSSSLLRRHHRSGLATMGTLLLLFAVVFSYFSSSSLLQPPFYMYAWPTGTTPHTICTPEKTHKKNEAKKNSLLTLILIHIAHLPPSYSLLLLLGLFLLSDYMAL